MTHIPAVPAFRYRAFISYSHQDAAWANWLHKCLETYRVPSRLVGTRTTAGVVPRRLLPVFRDREELASSHDLSGRIRDALADSANLIVICSPRSAASRWVQEEVLAFQQLGRGDRIFCLIVDGEPNASHQPEAEARECFVPALRMSGENIGPTHAEPIAADARAGKDGRRHAKLKLIAGMLGLGYDSLRQRELQRRNRRLTAITIAALLITGLTSSLAVVAWLSREAAEVARKDAERRQRQAEDLVGFMLGDLTDKLDQVRRLDIMDDVDARAMKYFAAMPTRDVTDEVLAQRAKALERIGSVRQGQGHLPEAIASFEASSRLAADLSRREPTNLARQVQYARSLSFVGQARWFQDELDLAEGAFARARDVLLAAQALAPGDLDALFEQEMVENNMGHVQEARGELDKAAVSYRHALELSSRLVAAQPDRADWSGELGGAHNNLGKLALLHGDLATAIAEYSADDSIETELARRHPEDNSQRESRLIVHAILGRTLALAGADAAATAHLRESVGMAEELMRSSPSNQAFRADFARYATPLARLLRLHGARDEARAWITRALAIVEELAAGNRTDAKLQRELAEAHIEHAAQLLDAGKRDEAEAAVSSGLNVLAPIEAKPSRDRAVELAGLSARILAVRIHAGDAQMAQLRQFVAGSTKEAGSGAGDPRLLALQAEAAMVVSPAADVRPAIHQLWEGGYREATWLAALRRAGVVYPVNAAFQKRLLADNAVAP